MTMTECANCGAVRPDDDLKEPADRWVRLDPGSEVPAGECPDCGALAYQMAVRRGFGMTAGELRMLLEGMADDLPLIVVVDRIDTAIKRIEAGTDAENLPVCWLVTHDVKEER